MVVKITKQALDTLKQLEERISGTRIVGQGSADVVVYSSELAALIAAIVALDNS